MKLKILIIGVLLLSGCQMFRIPFEFSTSIKQLTVGQRSSYIIDENNVLFGLGDSYGSGPKELTNDVIQVISDWTHTLALKSDGTLWEWGTTRTFTTPSFNQENVLYFVSDDVRKIWGNDEGLTYILMDDYTLKVNGPGECRVSPYNPNESLAWLNIYHVLHNVEDLYVESHTSNAIAKTKDGRYFIWGSNFNSKIGYDIIDESITEPLQTCIQEPIEISFDMEIKTMTLAQGTLYIIDKNDVLYGLGNNESNRINDSNQLVIETPYKIMENVLEVQSTQFSTFILTKDKTLYGLSNELGLLGLGHEDIIPSPIKLMENVSMFSSGVVTTIVLKDNGEIFAWGNNQHSQMGIANDKTYRKPIKIGQIRP